MNQIKCSLMDTNETSEKQCVTCGASAPHAAFGKNSGAKDGLFAMCKECVRISNRKSYQKNKDKKKAQQKQYNAANAERISAQKKEYRLKKDFGLTLAEYEAMLEAQEGRCRICGNEMEKPHVDHCHAKGAIRGLLCFRCNAGLGLFKDDIFLLESAIAYLR